MMTVFLFARLWRRSGLLTDVQFAEMRYSGKPAAFLRGFRAVYLGLLMNCLILGWVTKAMVNIISTAMGDRKSTRLNSSHGYISYAVFCLKKKKKILERVLISPTFLFPYGFVLNHQLLSCFLLIALSHYVSHSDVL